jgi:two-component system sensor histidine kinase KdpD
VYPWKAGNGLSGLHPIKGIMGAFRARTLPPALRRALYASRRSNRERSAAAQMANVLEFTRRTLQMNLSEKPGEKLAEQIQRLFGLVAVAIFDADLHEIYQAGEWTVDPSELVQNVFHFETSNDDPGTGISRRVIRLGAVPIGSLVLRGETSPLSNSLLAAVVAITFDRYRATANESRIEADREAEQMRAAVLDNLAHAYKTPLTAIRAASSGLSEMGRLSPSQSELVTLIDEQASLLNDLTTKLLTTARLESGAQDTSHATVRWETVTAGPLIDEVIGSLGERSASANIRVELPDEGLSLFCDRGLMAMLLTQYMDNACKYSHAGTTITVRAERAGNEVLFSVNSAGPVIPVAERERIFDRYYRSPNSAGKAAGTGIGLSIAKRAALAHHGSVWVSSDESGGNTFFAAIPDLNNSVSWAADTATEIQRSTS